MCCDCVILSHSGHKYERMEKEGKSDLMSFLTETNSAGSDLQDPMAQIEKSKV